MKKLIFVFSAILLILCSGKASGRTFGIGIIAGEPTGISAKLWLDKTMALNFAAAWSFVGEGSFHIHGDYLWHNFDLFKIKNGSLALFYGPGIYLNMKENSTMGARFPVGLDYFFESVEIDIFAEVVPILQLAPATVLGLNGGIGVRYNF